jgi:transposase InsO family protein
MHLKNHHLIEESGYSRSQFYIWLERIDERKKRNPKLLPMPVAERAVEVIKEYPHFGASKGQGFMIYHQLGYIPQHVYKMLKNIVKRLIFQEISRCGLLPSKTSYTHERPEKPGEIWAEDFTTIRVAGEKFYVSLVIDVASTYYLGVGVSNRAIARLVEAPVKQALDVSDGRGPERFLLSDNGTQYISDEHGELLESLDIIQRRIPSCTPEYNGAVECGIKEFKNVFYNVWSSREKREADKGKRLIERVQGAVADTAKRMNFEIPRLCLKGVTPADVFKGIGEERRVINETYLEKEQERKEEIKPWTKSPWNLVKDILFKDDLSRLELMTKFCFFLKRPLRKLSNLLPEAVG